MPSKSERLQAQSDAVASQSTNKSRAQEIMDLALLGKDIYDLLFAEIRVLTGNATEQDLVAAKQRKIGLDGRLDEIRARFRRDTGTVNQPQPEEGIDNT